jgi:hypothetical protein
VFLPTPALANVLALAASASEAALRRCLEQTGVLIQAAQARCQKQAELAELDEAWRELLAYGPGWCKQYPVELRKAFDAALQQAPAATAHKAPAREELALVDDAEIARAIASARLLQHVAPLLEQPVAELDALVSSALGLESVRPELNPLRPEVFTQVLHALLGPSPSSPLWMKHLAEPLGAELKAIYAQLVARLQAANVEAVGYRLAHSPAAGPAAPAAARAPLAPPAQGRRLELSGQQISQELLRDFMDGGLDQAAAQPLPQSYYASVERELDALRNQPDSEQGALEPAPASADYRALAAVDRPARSVGVQSALDARVWGPYARSRTRSLVRSELRKDATHAGQVLGLELVRKVVNQIAQDPRLLAPVREAIVALEPSLLRLAMVDACFFSEQSHPGRRLMEAVAQRSFKYNDEFGNAFTAFFHEVGTRFNELNGRANVDAAQFEQALAQLESLWQADDQRQEEQQQPALEAVQFAEQRQADADRIAWEMSSRSDLEDVPEVVREFLFGPWALVMAQARLKSATAHPDPQGYGGVITHLLWSVKPEVTLKQPAQLFERVPALVATLRGGLASIGQEAAESEPFFQALMKLHHPVLQLRRAKSRRDARESGLTPLLRLKDAEEATAAAPEKTARPLWMSPQELEAVGFQETLPTGAADLDDGAAPEPAAPDRPVPDDLLAQLRQGDWVDLFARRRWRRAQLAWASSKGTLFMFVSQGGRAHSMTRRICERLIREQLLRPVHTHEVVSEALQALRKSPDPTSAAATRPADGGGRAPQGQPAAHAAARDRAMTTAG